MQFYTSILFFFFFPLSKILGKSFRHYKQQTWHEDKIKENVKILA